MIKSGDWSIQLHADRHTAADNLPHSASSTLRLPSSAVVERRTQLWRITHHTQRGG